MFLNLDLCGNLPDYFLHALFTFLRLRAGSLPYITTDSRG
jgi:hypothetical protein